MNENNITHSQEGDRERLGYRFYLPAVTCLCVVSLSSPAFAIFDTQDLTFLTDYLRGLLSIKNFMFIAAGIVIVIAAIVAVIKTVGSGEGARGWMQHMKGPAVAAIVLVSLGGIFAYVGVDTNSAEARVSDEWNINSAPTS